MYWAGSRFKNGIFISVGRFSGHYSISTFLPSIRTNFQLNILNDSLNLARCKALVKNGLVQITGFEEYSNKII